MKSEGLFSEIESSKPGSIWHIYKPAGKTTFLSELGKYFESKGRLVCVLGSELKEFPRFIEEQDKISENMVLLIQDSEKFKYTPYDVIKRHGALCINTTSFRFSKDTQYYEGRGHLVREIK